MKRLLPSMAAAALALGSFACSNAADPATAASEPPATTEPAGDFPPPVVDATATSATPATPDLSPIGLREPNMLTDLPNERQFEPSKNPALTIGDGTLITSPPAGANPPPPPEPAAPPAPPEN
jgi:hypothetical protein